MLLGSKFQGPEARLCLTGPRNSKDVSVARADEPGREYYEMKLEN